MRLPSQLLRSVAVVAALLLGGRASAADVPAHLPRYDLDLSIDTDAHKAYLRERVTWTNHTRTPANHLAFNFYPHYRVPRGDYLHFAKTLEMLRLQPSVGIDKSGRNGVVKEAKLVALGGKPVGEALPFEFDQDNPTALRFRLPRPLDPGETVTVEIACEFFLPNKQGRVGHWEGVTFLTNAFPVLAFCDDTGWRPMPFIPWHQPWFNEAGVFTAAITVQEKQQLACPATVKSETKLDGGLKRVQTKAFVGRDFPVLCSARYKEFTGTTTLPDGQTVALRCLAFPEHEWYAKELITIVGEAIPVYSKWFGNFPYPQFTIAESYFGWNGNECAGLVMIDERIFAGPHLARGYVEYLVSHETCHQWWYNLVGTNGYSEPFVDEGAAAFFTHKLMDQKRGKNNKFMAWPEGFGWLPNIERENYRWGGMHYSIRNGEMHPAAQDLPQYKHLFGLFTGAYDRGQKVYGMIEERLGGEAAFLDFTRTLVTKYGWRVLEAKDLRRELEAYTGRDWGEFFDRWVYGKGMTDWKVESVTVQPAWTKELPAGPVERAVAIKRGLYRHTEVIVRQAGEFTEPTVVGFTLANGKTASVPVGSDKPVSLSGLDAVVTPLGGGRWGVKVALDGDPEQVEVDPGRVLLDANPGDNAWKSPPRVWVTPLYTMLDDTDLTSAHDRCNYTFGPWIWGASYQDPWYTRSTMIGLRAGVNKPQHFRAGLYTAIRSEYRDAVLGADATFLGDHHEIGLNYERRIGGPWFDQSGAGGPQRAAAYFRHVLKPGSSMYLPPIMYQDGFATYQDNFLPFPETPGGQRWDRMTMFGYHYRLNLYTPYWDPECGVWVDAMAGGGSAFFDGWKGMGQGRIELAAVRKLPDCLGPLRHTRFAARFVGMAAWPEYGQFFALGGGTLFRGFDLAERQGSALWVANAELRVPLARNVEWDALDHVIGARNVWLAGFYDAGAIYANRDAVGGGVAHALGVGLRVDVAVFSFIERAMLRFDVAKTINAPTPWQFWFGVQHAF